MIVMGYAGLGGAHVADVQATQDTVPDAIVISNAIFDQLYGNEDPNITTTKDLPATADWDYNTLFNAQFNGNLMAGNVDFALRDVQAVRIKRTEADTYNWITIAEKKTERPEDLSFNIVDYLARGNQNYKYAIVSVQNDYTEGEYNISTVFSDFNGLWVCEKDTGYNALLDLEMDTTLNQTTSNVVTLGNRYPYVNKYGKSNYYTGSFTTSFIHMSTTDCTIEVENGVKYREAVEDFLTDGMPKIIKHMDGRIWLAFITDTIPKSESDGYMLPLQTVNFVEIGRHDSFEDLYRAGLLDVIWDEEENI